MRRRVGAVEIYAEHCERLEVGVRSKYSVIICEIEVETKRLPREVEAALAARSERAGIASDLDKISL